MGDNKFWNAFVAAQDTEGGLDRLLAILEVLPVQQKLTVVQHLLGSGLRVGINNPLISRELAQLDLMDSGSLAAVLDAIADRIRSSGSNGQSGKEH